MKIHYECIGCFADQNGHCKALTHHYDKNCPFYKTVDQHQLDIAKAKLRLRKMYRLGWFNPEGLSNLRLQAHDMLREG